MGTVYNYKRFSGNIIKTLKQARKDNCDYVLQYYSPLISMAVGDTITVGIKGSYGYLKQYLKNHEHEEIFTVYATNGQIF